MCPGTEHGWQFEDDIFKIILKYDSCCTLILILRRFVSKCPNNNKPALRLKIVCITLVSRWAPWLLKSPAYRLFWPFVQAHSKKFIKTPRVTGLCEGNSPMTSGLHSQKASNAENVSIWWRHHGWWTGDKPLCEANDDQVHWRIYASLSPKVLRHVMIYISILLSCSCLFHIRM